VLRAHDTADWRYAFHCLPFARRLIGGMLLRAILILKCEKKLLAATLDV